jgi:hypothetical protein
VLDDEPHRRVVIGERVWTLERDFCAISYRDRPYIVAVG